MNEQKRPKYYHRPLTLGLLLGLLGACGDGAATEGPPPPPPACAGPLCPRNEARQELPDPRAVVRDMGAADGG